MQGDICKIILFFIFIHASVKIQEVETVVGIGTGIPVQGSPNRYEKYVNTCELAYKKHVENKSDVFVAVTNEPGLCLITRQANVSDINYQWQIYNYAGIPLGNATKFVSRAVAPSAPGDNSPVPTVMVPIFDKPVVADEDMESNAPFFKKQNVAGLNYDSQEQWIFFLLRNPDSKEERELYRANINGTERKLLFNNKISTNAKEYKYVEIKKPIRDEYKMKALTDIAYDWISKNVYFSNKHEIYAINALNAWDPIRIVSNRSEIISPVVHPNFGYLYFIDYNRTIVSKSIFDDIKRVEEYAIYRINLDGSNLVKISETSDDDIVSLAIDFHTDRLYWSRPNARIIQHSNLDGSDVKNITGNAVYYGLRSAGTHSIGFDKNYVYYIKAGTNSIHRFNKTDNKEDEDYDLTTRVEDQIIFELVIFDFDAQKIRVDHPCFKNNGGCQKFCFPVPKEDYTLERICKCSLGEDLEDDGVSCRGSVL